jgi:hypothetical protein
MSLFNKYFTRLIQEEIGMTSGGAEGVFGAGGDQGGSFPGGGDFYASGDARIPDILGSKKRRKKRRKKKRKSKKVKKEQIKIQRRNLSRTL